MSKNTVINFLSEQKSKLKNFFKRRKIKVASLEETINKIKNERCSVSRFGDGEFYIMDGGGIKFQKADENLSQSLKKVFFDKDQKNCLICIVDSINPKNYKQYTEKHLAWQKKYYKNSLETVLKYMTDDRVYYNARLSRFWIPYKDKERAKRIAARLKEIWQDKNVVIVEGKETRMGEGNDLLNEVKSCKRILCPATDAFDKYDEILAAAKTFPKDVLFLIALGPTATVLAYDLCKEGYQAIDIGHIDLEYEWMRMGAKEQVNLTNKFVNEVAGGEKTEIVTDKNYINSIVFDIV